MILITMCYFKHTQWARAIFLPHTYDYKRLVATGWQIFFGGLAGNIFANTGCDAYALAALMKVLKMRNDNKQGGLVI